MLSQAPRILIEMDRANVNGSATNRAHLLAPTLGVRRATSKQLQDRIRSTIRIQNQAAAIRARRL